MKISKFPLFSLILLVGTTIYAIVFCPFEGAKILSDNRCKAFIKETMTTFLNDFEKAKEYKVPELSDESLTQLQAIFKNNFGQCKFKDISMLQGFQIDSSMILKKYKVILDCTRKKEMPVFVTVRQKDDQVKYFGMRGEM